MELHDGCASCPFLRCGAVPAPNASDVLMRRFGGRRAGRHQPPVFLVSVARVGGGERSPAGVTARCESELCAQILGCIVPMARRVQSLGVEHAAAPLWSSARRPDPLPEIGGKRSESFLLRLVVVKRPRRLYCGFSTTRGGGKTSSGFVLRFYHHPGPIVFSDQAPAPCRLRGFPVHAQLQGPSDECRFSALGGTGGGGRFRQLRQTPTGPLHRERAGLKSLSLPQVCQGFEPLVQHSEQRGVKRKGVDTDGASITQRHRNWLRRGWMNRKKVDRFVSVCV